MIRTMGPAWFVLLVSCAVGHADEGQGTAITPDRPETVQAGIVAAANGGAKTIVIPPGVYKITPGRGGWHLQFTDLHDLVIDATGATFLWQDRTRGGIEFLRCKNVTLRGATLRQAVMPFTQGTIAAIGADHRSLDVKIDAGYPAEFDNPRFFPRNPTGYVMDARARRWKTGTLDYSAERVERLSDGLFRLHFGGPIVGAVEVDDPMAFRGNGVTDVRVGDCENLTLDGVTIQNGGGFCVHESEGPGGNHYRFTLTYGPRPEGATTDPLIACNADAFHSSGVRKGPTLEGCSFEGMPDDGIAIHGQYEQVDRSEGETLIVGTFGRTSFAGGDPIRVYDNRGVPVGSAVVMDVKKRDDLKPSADSKIRSFKGRKLQYFALTLDHPIDAGFDSVAANPAFCGAGFVARHNTIKNHRARGMLLKADDGLVEENTVDGSTIAGIVIAPEPLYWNEADYAHRVIVRKNTVRHTGLATSGPWMNQAAGIVVSGEGDGLGNQDIRIEDNTIEDIAGASLQIDHAQGVVLKGNRFVRPNQIPSRNGADQGVDPKAIISLSLCRDVTLEANTFEDRGPVEAPAVFVAPTAQEIKGLPDGLKESKRP